MERLALAAQINADEAQRSQLQYGKAPLLVDEQLALLCSSIQTTSTLEVLSLTAFARRHHDLSSACQEGPSDECHSQAMHSLQEDYEVSTAVKRTPRNSLASSFSRDRSIQSTLPDHNASGVAVMILSDIGIVTVLRLQ